MFFVSFGGQTDRQTDQPTDRQTDRPTDQQTDRLTDRQTDGPTDLGIKVPSRSLKNINNYTYRSKDDNNSKLGLS